MISTETAARLLAMSCHDFDNAGLSRREPVRRTGWGFTAFLLILAVASVPFLFR